MSYVYILFSDVSKNFYYGYTSNIKKRFEQHQKGLVFSTKSYLPWRLIFYAAFDTIELAKRFEKYLKTGSGKSFAYKRLVDTAALKKDKVTSKRYSEAQRAN